MYVQNFHCLCSKKNFWFKHKDLKVFFCKGCDSLTTKGIFCNMKYPALNDEEVSIEKLIKTRIWWIVFKDRQYYKIHPFSIAWNLKRKKVKDID